MPGWLDEPNTRQPVMMTPADVAQALVAEQVSCQVACHEIKAVELEYAQLKTSLWAVRSELSAVSEAAVKSQEEHHKAMEAMQVSETRGRVQSIPPREIDAESMMSSGHPARVAHGMINSGMTNNLAQSLLLVDERMPFESAVEAAVRTAKARRALLLGFCLAILFSQYLLITFLSPFLPHVAKQHGVGSASVGVILAMDSFATAFVSPIVGFKMDEYGTRAVIMTGLLISSVVCLVIGFLPQWCPDSTSFTIAFVTARWVV